MTLTKQKIDENLPFGWEIQDIRDQTDFRTFFLMRHRRMTSAVVIGREGQIRGSSWDELPAFQNLKRGHGEQVQVASSTSSSSVLININTLDTLFSSTEGQTSK